jgi:serine/threonine-protein kinase
MRFRPGETVGRYEIRAALGSGGMGEVYRARDGKLDRDVAIKFVAAPDGRSSASLSLSEARAAAALSHPNLCTLFEVEEGDGEPFIVMELVEGQPLASLVGVEGLPERSVRRWGAQIAAGVAHAHDRRIVHRDLKCGNVMITSDGRAKVLDFGIARRYATQDVEQATTVARALDETGTLAGTLPYMAPELLRGEAPTPASDVWALGIVLFEMATGHRPFTGRTSVDLTSAILREPVPAMRPETTPALVAIVRRCLEKQPGARYPNAGQVAAALEVIDSDVQQAPTASRRSLARAGLAAGVLILVLGAVALLWRGRPSPGALDAPIRSLAILPLSDLSGSTSDEYFVDGITDALIGEIGQLESLSVIARTSVMRYKGSTKSIPEIARELNNVDAVLEGSVLRVGSRVRVTAQLVQAKTALSLWTNTYEREIGDIIALQRDLARTVAGALRIRLTPAQASRLAKPSPVAPAAAEAYLRGRYQWNKRTAESLLASIRLFEEAARHDASYAAPLAGLASSYVLLGGLAIGETPSSDSLPKARQAALQALALDPDLVEGHAALGYTLLYQWDLPGSERELRRAIDLNANDATARFWYAVRLAAEARFDQALAEVARARELDPVSPIVTAGVSWMNHFARRHDRAAAFADAALALEPEFQIGLARSGVAAKHLGDYPRAIAQLERAVKLSNQGPDHLAQLGQALALQGRRADARAILDRLADLATRRYVPAYDFALVHASLGEADEAFRWLRRAFDQRYGPLVFLSVDPDVDALRADPRMAVLIGDVKRGAAQ